MLTGTHYEILSKLRETTRNALLSPLVPRIQLKKCLRHKTDCNSN